MDNNKLNQFRLRLAQINGIKINEAKDHVSTEIDYIGDASDRAEDAKTHGVKITPSRKKVQDSDHSVSGPRENVRKFLVHHYGDKAEAKENHPEVFKGMNEEKIDEDFEVGRKVNVTNPKATPRYEITDKDDTHYHLKNPDGKTMKLPKERIHRVNKSNMNSYQKIPGEMNEEQIDEADHHILARVSKDDGKMTQKSVIVTTKNRDAAMVRAERHFRDKGMKVHALKYVRQSDSAPYLPGSSNVREENQMNEEQIDEATIRHVLPKKQVAGHIKRVENSFGWEHGKHYHIVPLPADHELAKTHAGLVFKARHGRKDLEGAVNADGGRGARQVDDHYNLAKSDPQQLDKPIHVKNMRYLVNNVNEEQIDEVVRSVGLMPLKPATEDQRAPTLKTYHTAMAKYSHLPPPTAHINALNDTIDKHGSENARQHVTKHFYSHMQKYLSDED